VCRKRAWHRISTNAHAEPVVSSGIHVVAYGTVKPLKSRLARTVLSLHLSSVHQDACSALAQPANSHQLRNLDELTKVKAEEGSDIVLWGSSTLYPQLLDANLIDRLVLLTIPIVLGKGKRIFGNTSHQVAMKLTKCEATPTGVIMATYEKTPGCQ
jgi:riboflavin biosynthesis pyrimidine reductase